MEYPDSFDSDHYFIYGDVYEALEACERLGQMLSRLKRQSMLPESIWSDCKEQLSAIEASVRSVIPQRKSASG